MMWFFAVLIVLTLGAVAAVAAGHGRPMSSVYPDRADVVLPAEGPLSSADLRRVRFTLGFRGYRMDEVDTLLERLAQEKDGAVSSAPPPEVSDPEKPASPSPGKRRLPFGGPRSRP